MGIIGFSLSIILGISTTWRYLVAKQPVLFSEANGAWSEAGVAM